MQHYKEAQVMVQKLTWVSNKMLFESWLVNSFLIPRFKHTSLLYFLLCYWTSTETRKIKLFLIHAQEEAKRGDGV